jgi:hypothetical protein
MNMEKSCQQKNSDSSKKFVRTPLIAIRRGPVLYTPKNAIFAAPGAARTTRTEGARRRWQVRRSGVAEAEPSGSALPVLEQSGLAD